MNRITRFLSTHTVFGLALVAALALAACDSVQVNPGDEIDEATAEEASVVVAEALSDQHDGLMAELYDLTATFDQNGIAYAEGVAAAKGDGDPRPWRGRHHDFSWTYNPETGEHTLAYERSVTNPNFEKSVAANLVYIFTDADGNFIATPKQEREAIAAIAFEGMRSGSSSGSAGRSGREHERSFTREAAWTLDGVNTDAMTLEGVQSHVGARKHMRGDSLVSESSHTLRMEAVDVVISTSEAEDGTLERAVTGTLHVTGTMTRTRDGDTVIKDIDATIELEGNGQALLRFMGLNKLYRVQLDEGTVEEDGN